MPPRRGRPRLDEDVQRRRILDAATRIFTQRHFSGTSLDLVAREAGVTKRTIYALVGDKTALFRAVCDYGEASVARIQFPEVAAGMTLRDILTTLAHTLLTHALEPSRVALARLVMRERAKLPELATQVLELGSDRFYAQIEALFEATVALGIAEIPDTALAAIIFYDIVVGNLSFRATIGFDVQPFPAPELQRRITVFIRGYVEAED